MISKSSNSNQSRITISISICMRIGIGISISISISICSNTDSSNTSITIIIRSSSSEIGMILLLHLLSYQAPSCLGAQKGFATSGVRRAGGHGKHAAVDGDPELGPMVIVVHHGLC